MFSLINRIRVPATSAIAKSNMLFSATYATKSIFVGNLAWSVKDNDLGNLFSQYGDVKAVRVLTDRETGRSRGFGFVEMEEDVAAEAIAQLNGTDLKGREIRVNAAEEKTERAPRREFRERSDRQ
ncbi:hypothetical protein HDV05_004232 [Chytridiales sp. JEL 0842]|nr:hypothetical protein HDV05_004232 [Chytridiales sp. JEL 0842]